MRVVVVGAGAVGKVYASHLVRGGAEVAFRVRRPASTRRPFVVHPLNGRVRETVRFDVPVLGTDDEVAAFHPDVALLTVPADALRGDWLAPFLRACGEALVVALEPGVDEASVIRAARPDVKLAQGIITLIAYEAPLPGETRFTEPGTAVWYPPFAAPFAGELVGPFAEALRRGGMRTRVAARGIAGESAFGTIVFATYISGIHAAGWSFAALREGEELRLAATAASECAAIAERQTGLRRPLWLRFVGPASIRAVLALGERLLPIPLETYLRVHFTKVGAQTALHLANAIGEGERLGLPVDAIRALAERVAAWDRAHPA